MGYSSLCVGFYLYISLTLLTLSGLRSGFSIPEEVDHHDHPQHRKASKTRLVTHTLIHICWPAVPVLVLFPLYWMISTRSNCWTILHVAPVWIPTPSPRALWSPNGYPWLQFLWNTVSSRGGHGGHDRLLAPSVAYGFTYFRAPGRTCSLAAS